MHVTRLEVLLLRWHKANRFAQEPDPMAAAHSVYSTKSQATGIYGSIRFQPSERPSAKGIYESIRFQPSSKPRDIRGLAPQSSHLLVPSLVRSGATSHRTCENYPTQGRHHPSTLIPRPMRLPPYHEHQGSPGPEGPNNPSSAPGRGRATKGAAYSLALKAANDGGLGTRQGGPPSLITDEHPRCLEGRPPLRVRGGTPSPVVPTLQLMRMPPTADVMKHYRSTPGQQGINIRGNRIDRQ